jgi:hypothetical protein
VVTLILPIKTPRYQVLLLDAFPPVNQSHSTPLGPLAKSSHDQNLYHHKLSRLENIVLVELHTIARNTRSILLCLLLKVMTYYVLYYFLQLLNFCSNPLTKFCYRLMHCILQISAEHCCKPVQERVPSFSQEDFGGGNSCSFGHAGADGVLEVNDEKLLILPMVIR